MLIETNFPIFSTLKGGALLHIKEEFHASDGLSEIIVGAAKLGAVGGTFLGGTLMLYYGRRLAIAADSIFFILGPIIMASAWNVAGLIVGRFIIGIGIGISAVVVPSYLGEVAPAKARGRIVELYEVILCLGMLTSALADAALDDVTGNWRWMVGAPAIPALLMSLAVCLLPESPRWLVVQGRLDDALAVIHRVHTNQLLPVGAQWSTGEVENELMELWSSVEKDKAARRALASSTFTSSSLQGLHQTHAGSIISGSGVGKSKRGRRINQKNSAKSGGGSSELAQLNPSAQDSAAAAAAPGDTQSALRGINSMSRTVSGDTQWPPPRPPSRKSSIPGSPPAVEDDEVLSIPKTLPRIRTRSRDRLDLMAEETITNNNNNNNNRNSADDDGGDDRDEYSDGEEEAVVMPSNPVAAAASTTTTTIYYHDKVSGFWATGWCMLKDIVTVARGPESSAFTMILILAFFNQAFASTAVINYAPTVLQDAGVESGATASLFTSFIGIAKLVGVILAFFLVDSVGRRPLLLWGSLGSCFSLLLLIPGDWLESRVLLLVGMCLFIFSFSISWAGVFWVLLSESFSMGAKSPAASAATAALFLTGAGADLLFLTLHDAMGPFVFLLYAGIAASAAVYVAAAVPETKGKTLQEVQEVLARRTRRQWHRHRLGGSGVHAGGGGDVGLSALELGRSTRPASDQW